MPIRPKTERKLRAGFQRHVDRQSNRYAVQLTRAEQLARRFECGEVTGVFSTEVGGGNRPRAVVVASLPIAAIPLLIIGAAAGMPLEVLGAWPFFSGAWFGLWMWRSREPKRRIWFYAFTEGFILLDDPRADAVPVRWSQVTDVSEVRSEAYNVNAEESSPALTAYRLRCADGQTHEVTRSFQNVRDPYPDVGPLLRSVMPASVSNTMPAFLTIDGIIAAYAGKPGPRA